MTHSNQVSFVYLFGFIFDNVILALRTPEAFAVARKEVDLILSQCLNDNPVSLSKEQLESMTVLGRSYY